MNWLIHLPHFNCYSKILLKNSHSIQSLSPLPYSTHLTHSTHPASPASPLYSLHSPYLLAPLPYSTRPTPPLSVPILMGMLPTAQTVQTQRFCHISTTTQNLFNNQHDQLLTKKDLQMYNIRFDFIKIC
ncbi:MAG: hypothetical protein LBQ31_05725 [Bacteroidales bacterium]|nr:hypothetical protein [Bacteroidales bacterium]